MIGIVVADAGYLSEDNLTAPGPDRLIAVGKAYAVELAARTNPEQGPPPDTADRIEAMGHRPRTPEGIATYRQRSHIAETPCGHGNTTSDSADSPAEACDEPPPNGTSTAPSTTSSRPSPPAT